MKAKILIILTGFIAAFSMAFMIQNAPAEAINVYNACSGNPDSAVCKARGSDNATSLMTVIINTMLFLLGSIAVIMIIVGGIRYVTSNGDASKVKSAKDTVLYSVVGLVVAIMAYAIVKFVIDRFK